VVEALQLLVPESRHAYLASLREADRNMRELTLRILSGSIDTALL
jgi:hypothetical protein